MRILQPNGRRRLDEQLVEACVDRDGFAPRCLVVLVQGLTRLADLEPFATLERILGEDFDRELRVVGTDGWPERFWATECGAALDAAEPDGTFDWRPSADQRKRALEQRVDDGRLEVLFVERGRVAGSALTVVARRRPDDAPLPLNVKLTTMELLNSARDAFLANPRPMQQLVHDARGALGMPSGPTLTIAQVRRERGEAVPTRRVSIDQLDDALRELSRPTGVGVSTQEVVRPPIVRVTPARSSPPAPPAPPKKASPEERHAVEDGRCTRCGKSDRLLEGACGKPEHGRIGFLELD